MKMTFANIGNHGGPTSLLKLGYRSETINEAIEYLEADVLNKFLVNLDDNNRITIEFWFGDEDEGENEDADASEYESHHPFLKIILKESAPKGVFSVECDECLTNCKHKAAVLLICHAVLSPKFEILGIDDGFENLHKSLTSALEEQEEQIIQWRNGKHDNSEVVFKGISIKRDFPSETASDNTLERIFESLQEVKIDPHKFKPQKIKPGPWPEVFSDVDFGSKLNNYFYTQESKQNLIKTAGLFWYHFSDGRALNSQQIIRHPLNRAVPKAFLPDVEDIFNSSLDIGPWSSAVRISEQRYWGGNFDRVERMMHGLLQRIVKASNSGELDFYIRDSQRPEWGVKVRQVIQKISGEFSWEVKSSSADSFKASLLLLPKNPKANWISLDRGAYESNQGDLILQPISTEVNHVAEIFGFYGIYEKKSASLPYFGEIQLSDQECLYHGVDNIRSCGVDVRFVSGTYDISNYDSQIHLDKTGRFSLSHTAKIPSFGTLAVSGISRELAILLSFMDGGIPAVLNIQARELAVRSQPKREWDLKLLKHIGVFHYIVLELCSFLLEGQLTSGVTLKDKRKFWSAISKNVYDLIKNDKNLTDVPIEKLCSGKTMSHFESFVKWFLETFDQKTTVYANNSEIHFRDLPKKDLWVFYGLLKEHVLSNGGNNLKKSRATFLDKVLGTQDPEHSSEHLEDNYRERITFKVLREKKADCGFKSEAAMSIPSSSQTANGDVLKSLVILRPLLEKGFSLYLNGKPLEQLSENDFLVQFVLKDSEQDSKDTSGIRHLDWFELNPKVFLKGQEIDAGKGIKFGEGGVVEYQGKLYIVPRKQIPSLKQLESFWTRLQKGSKKTTGSFLSEKIVAMPRSQIFELLALRSSGYSVNGNKEWENIVAFYDSLGSKRKPIKLPKTINAELKPYQVEGVQWLCDLNSLKMGALLGDDMGLGKTLQTLSFLEIQRSQKKLGATLVIVPPSLIYNWQSEAEKFVPHLKVQVFSGKVREKFGHIAEKNPLVLITTYGVLAENEALFSSLNWQTIIFDEAQNLKNITTKRTAAARSLKAQFKICLTGTPMENHYGEFYSLMDLLVPGSLGPVEEFRQRYVNSDHVAKEDVDHLKLKVKPLVLRRTKKEILSQLPNKIESKINISFESRQKKLYRDVAISCNEIVQQTIEKAGESKSQLQMLTALLRLRQVCSDPAALPNVTYAKVPPKLETLLGSVSEIVESGESALVFTQFLSTLGRAENILKNEGIPVHTIHGGVSASQRQKILKSFQEMEKGSVLLMTLKTGGVGLNLTKASYVFHLEPWWNPAVENQATDRAHRMGQEKSVQVFRYIMHESVEEKIEMLKGRKESKFRSLFENVESDADIGTKSGSRLTKEDFDLLIALDEEKGA